METQFIKIYGRLSTIPQHTALFNYVFLDVSEEVAAEKAKATFEKQNPIWNLEHCETRGSRRFPGYGKKL